MLISRPIVLFYSCRCAWRMAISCDSAEAYNEGCRASEVTALTVVGQSVLP